jgi:hypothetical protein
MGSQNPKARVYAPQSGLEPHFHITRHEYEVSPDGTVTICAYEERRGELILRYTSTMTAPNLIRSSRAGSTMAAEAHNLFEFAKMRFEDGGTGGSSGNSH